MDFVSFVLDDVQGFWGGYFDDAGENYPDAELVLFRNSVQSGCGPASAATGPFYCPVDSKAYIDLAFFRELTDRFGAPGDFAQAYVLAHELGHHVQNVLGINAEVQRLGQQDPTASTSSPSGWSSKPTASPVSGPTPPSSGTSSATATSRRASTPPASVGDDRLGVDSPESFTHGTSEQRVHWLRTGYETGDVQACDTFSSGRVGAVGPTGQRRNHGAAGCTDRGRASLRQRECHWP